MRVLMPLIYFLMFNASLVIITKKTFGKVLPLTFFISIMSLFISGIVFNTFNVGLSLNIIFSLYPIFYFIKNKNKFKPFLKKYLSNGFYIFILLYVITTVFDLNRTFTRWDEFSHWGQMVKEMFRLDKFYCIDASTLQAHKDYPPAIGLFELLFCKLTGEYNESSLIQSMHLLEFSLFIPFISEKINIKDKYKLIINSFFIISFIYIFISLFDQQVFINTIYIDYVLAIIPAHIICDIILEKDILSKYSIISLSISLSVLLLTKQMGLPLFLIVLFVYFYKLISQKEIKKENVKKLLKAFIFIIIIPLLFYKVWTVYSSTYNTNPQFKLSDIKIDKLPAIVNGTDGKDYQKTASTNFLNAFYKKDITREKMNLTYVKSIIISLIILYLVYLYGKDYIKEKYLKMLGFTIIMGALGYAFVMLNLYVFNFGSSEGPSLASFERYMATYVIFALSIDIMIFISIYSSKNKLSYIPVIITLTLIIFINPEQLEYYSPALIKKEPDMFEKEASIIKEKASGKKVFIIAQNSIGQYQFYLKYYASPITVNLDDFDIPKYPEINDKNKLKQKIDKYDFLFLANLDISFYENYNSWFEKDTICTGCLYITKGDKFIKYN